jgi:L-asparagine transporter-like permease
MLHGGLFIISIAFVIAEIAMRDKEAILFLIIVIWTSVLFIFTLYMKYKPLLRATIRRRILSGKNTESDCTGQK